MARGDIVINTWRLLSRSERFKIPRRPQGLLPTSISSATEGLIYQMWFSYFTVHRAAPLLTMGIHRAVNPCARQHIPVTQCTSAVAQRVAAILPNVLRLLSSRLHLGRQCRIHVDELRSYLHQSMNQHPLWAGADQIVPDI